MPVIIDSEADLQQGLAELIAADPVMAGLVAAGAHPPLRRREPGFPGLAAIIVAQQLSTASAGAILARLEARFPGMRPQGLAAASDEDLRTIGLSAAKIRTFRSLADAVLDGSLPLERLAECSADEAHRLMRAVKGIGPWTADIYLLFSLGHADAFAAGDLALQEAARIAYRLNERPGEKALLALAERWRPWRGIAARVLWAYYRIAKAREGVP